MTDLVETVTVQWDSALEAIERCYELGWTDGLPVVPPTDYRVGQFLEHVGRPAAEVVGELPERRREITVGKVAANAVMAGCLPEHLPVVLAATAVTFGVWLTFGPAPAGTYVRNVSPIGCYGMIGDVWEWTSTNIPRSSSGANTRS